MNTLQLNLSVSVEMILRLVNQREREKERERRGKTKRKKQFLRIMSEIPSWFITLIISAGALLLTIRQRALKYVILSAEKASDIQSS